MAESCPAGPEGPDQARMDVAVWRYNELSEPLRRVRLFDPAICSSTAADGIPANGSQDDLGPHAAIRIIRNLSLDATHRAQLFKTAAARFNAHTTANRDDFATSCLLVLVMLNPDA